MSGRLSASAWNTRASIYMPVPAIAQAMRAPNGPVAVANRPGRLKIPAPTMEPMTMAVSDESGSFCSSDELIGALPPFACRSVITLPRATKCRPRTRNLHPQHVQTPKHDGETANLTNVEDVACRAPPGAHCAPRTPAFLPNLRLRHGDPQRPLNVCAVKGGAFQWVQDPPGQTLQPEATGAVMEVTKWLKPSV